MANPFKKIVVNNKPKFSDQVEAPNSEQQAASETEQNTAQAPENVVLSKAYGVCKGDNNTFQLVQFNFNPKTKEVTSFEVLRTETNRGEIADQFKIATIYFLDEIFEM